MLEMAAQRIPWKPGVARALIWIPGALHCYRPIILQLGPRTKRSILASCNSLELGWVALESLSASRPYGILLDRMEEIEHFVPGEQEDDDGVVSRLRCPIPAGVARAYADAYTGSGETILMPYCQGPAAVREILAAGRRVLALNFDPLLVLVVKAALAPVPDRDLDSAVARLGDSLKQGMPLRRYLSELYATTCPACLRPAIADSFIWDRELDAPIAKQLRCPACAWDDRSAVDAEDRQRLDEIPARGMHYHYVLDRVAPQPGGEALRGRLDFLLELYSPRSLYALAEVTLRIESMFPGGPLQQALKLLVVDCLDRCSELVPLPESVARQRGLARPNRFLERNVWQAFEEAAARYRNWTRAPVDGLAETLAEFQLQGDRDAGFVGQGLVRDLARSLPPRTFRLILASPPPFDSATWSLSYLWGAWLLGSEAVAPLRPLLRQRTPEAGWYSRVMAGSFRTLAGLLRDDGRLVLVLTDQRPVVVEALVLAASDARLGVASLVQRGADYRLELVPSLVPPPQPVAVSSSPLQVQIQKVAIEAATATIHGRGEPVDRRTLHVAIQQRLAQAGLLAKVLEAERELSPLDVVAEWVEAGLQSSVFVQKRGERGEGLWWLAEPPGVASPLSDRVEDRAYQVLLDTLALTEADFAARVYTGFPGILTPDAALVSTCLRSYGREPTPGYWQLRKEDLSDARRSERQQIIADLLAVGRRLGYQARSWDPFDAAWFEADQPRAAFVVRWQASVSEALALGSLRTGANPYLVIPGGRAALVSYKLVHNPLWQEMVDEAGWRFIKYRHIRQLVAQPEVSEHALRTIVGLDPIVERESAQIPLF
jgi:hypothetical protein